MIDFLVGNEQASSGLPVQQPGAGQDDARGLNPPSPADPSHANYQTFPSDHAGHRQHVRLHTISINLSFQS